MDSLEYKNIFDAITDDAEEAKVMQDEANELLAIRHSAKIGDACFSYWKENGKFPDEIKCIEKYMK